jgi:hypothetical protein
MRISKVMKDLLDKTKSRVEKEPTQLTSQNTGFLHFTPMSRLS